MPTDQQAHGEMSLLQAGVRTWAAVDPFLLLLYGMSQLRNLAVGERQKKRWLTTSIKSFI
jgi:hypothetical protein